MTTPTIDEVDAQYGEGRRTLTDGQAKQLLDRADRLANDVYGSRIAREGEIEGNEKDFKILLTCHLWELAEGGELQSHSQTGGSVTYNTVTGEMMSPLSETRWGRLARNYLRDGQSIGVERTR